MTEALDRAAFIKMIGGAIATIRENQQLLSELDTAIGDGDHGVTMARAMQRVESTMAANTDPSLKALIDDIAWTLMGIDGGAAGPLLGTLFSGMGDGVADAEELDGAGVARMFEGGLAALQRQTKATIGDKTMMDALIPAVAVLKQAAAEGKPIAEMLLLAADAAEQGAVSTREFRARFGRAKNQGDRTIGHQDPGATSTALLFRGFHAALSQAA